MRRSQIVVPLAWTLALAAAVALFHRIRSSAPLELSAPALLAELGFWALYCAATRSLCRLSAWTLLVSVPLLLAVLALAAMQEAHRALYGVPFDPESVRLVRTNWELVVTAVLDYLGGLPLALPLAAAALVAVFVVALVRSRAPAFRPLHAGAAYAAASLLVGAWWLAPPLPARSQALAPGLGALSLAFDLRAALARPARGPVDRAAAAPESESRWKPERSGVRAVPQAPPGPRPDIVLVLLESVRADHLSVYGYARETSPHLRAFAEGPDVWRFSRAFSNSTLSYISLLSLLSGYGLDRPAQDFAESALIWDQLAARGYQSCFVTISMGYWRYRLDRFLATPGLGRYRDLGQEQVAATPRTPPRGLRERFLRGALGEAGFRALGIDRDDALGLAALRECVEARDPARPLLAVWELEGTHYPYQPPQPVPWAPASSYTLSIRDPVPLANAYDNAILAADRRIGELLDWLDASGRGDHTLLLVTSDHGEAFWERGQVFHGGLQPEQVWVPLLVRIPARLQSAYPAAALEVLAANRQQPVQLVDLAPTLVGLADGSGAAPDPATSDGANLLGPLPPDREILVSRRSPFSAPGPHPHAVVRAGALVIRHPDGGVERFELADFGAQPAVGAGAAGGNTRIPANSQ